MHYLLFVPELADDSQEKPGTIAEAKEKARAAANAAFAAKLASLDVYSDALLSRVMLHVLDEKWKDHLYDLDQLRAAIHYRSWGQKDPLVEYKHEAYTMFVDLMSDLYHTFAERFLRAQIVIEQQGGPAEGSDDGSGGGRRGPRVPAPSAPTRRYNALGILEDVPPESEHGGNVATEPGEPEGEVDIGPDEAPKKDVVARKEARIVGAGPIRNLSAQQNTGNTDWSAVGRNDPCPCGSGKKFKKCHGATV
jgi:preprotein translocase subunit SecA